MKRDEACSQHDFVKWMLLSYFHNSISLQIKQFSHMMYYNNIISKKPDEVTQDLKINFSELSLLINWKPMW